MADCDPGQSQARGCGELRLLAEPLRAGFRVYLLMALTRVLGNSPIPSIWSLWSVLHDCVEARYIELFLNTGLTSKYTTEEHLFKSSSLHFPPSFIFVVDL